MVDGPYIRCATEEDECFLWQVLAKSSYATATEVRAHPEISKYLIGWKRDGDIGFVALNDEGHRIGAAWIRKFEQENSPFHFLPEAPSQLVIATCAPGRGIGFLLLDQLNEHVDSVAPRAISLNVRKENRAVFLYRRMGYRVISEIANRVGGISLIMVRDAR